MAKFLIQGNYTTEGVRGLQREGASGRVQAIERLIGSIGGRLEAFYFSFGADDFLTIVDFEGADGDANVTAAAVSLTVAASGAVDLRTTVLLTAEELDRATRIVVPYRAPGA